MRALRALGIPLEQVKGVLDSSSEDLAGMHRLLAAQLGRLSAQADQIQRLIEQVRGLLRRLETGAMPDPDQFMTTLEMISILDNFFTDEQRRQMQAAIGRLWQDHSSDILQTLPWPAEKMTALYAYLERACAARDGS